MTDASRSYPSRPILAASVAVFRNGKVLLGERSREPGRGLFSLPGGVVELGETLEEAARREVREETGLEVEIAGFVRHNQVVYRDEAGAVHRHFVIVVFAARSEEGEPSLSEETLSFRWVEPATLDGLPVTDRLADIVTAAQAVLS
jgi:8-oxo-dGTP diphosphatase